MTEALSNRVGVPVGEQLKQLQTWLAEAGLRLPTELPPSLDAETEPEPNEVRILCLYLAGVNGQTDLDATADFYLRVLERQAAALGIQINLGMGIRHFWGKLRPAKSVPEPGLYYCTLNLGERDPNLPSLGASIGYQMMIRNQPAGMEVLACLAHSQPALFELAGTTLDEIPLAGLKVGVPNGVGGTFVPVASGRLKNGVRELVLATMSPDSTHGSGWAVPTVRPVR